MKYTALATIFTLFVVIAAKRLKRCNSSIDCSEGECCATKLIFGFARGFCKPMALDGENCCADEDAVLGKYIFHCPCKNGLSCIPEEVKDFGFLGIIKFNETCVSVPTSDEPETEAPIDETEQPVEETAAPIIETEEPVEETEAPIEETEQPVVEESESPAEE